MGRRKKILFIQPSLNPPGGGGAVVIWMLYALKEKYDVTVFVWDTPIIADVNRYYGTSFKEGDIKIKVMPSFIRFVIDTVFKDPWHFHRWGCLMRRCRMYHHNYHAVISANNETDFGVKGIQYVHYPYLHDNWFKEVRLSQQNKWYSKLITWVETHLRPWRIISGFSYQRMKKNVTLINSHWTGERYKEIYNETSHVLYPPAPGTFPDIGWHDRENGFVCISRISSEKRIIEIIDIIAALRVDYPELHLHIIGSQVEYDDTYYKQVKKHSEQYSSWVFWEEDISRQQLETMVSQHRYGIHGMQEEHFGIAVAEMLRAGCITFAPNSGGPIEILGNEPRLLYNNSQDAHKKISNVIQSEKLQQQLREQLQARKPLFTTEQFISQTQKIVAEFLNKQLAN